MSAFSPAEQNIMQQCLALALQAKGKTFPNPAVGAIIARGRKVIATGATHKAGGPHAEIVALKKAGKKARGATLYVTLEPCCHYGKTPPCTDAIIAAGVKKAVIACKDPNPLVSGKGIRILRKNGIEIKTGLLRKTAMEINEDFAWSVIHGMPWIALKLAMTLDGRIADAGGSSRWITNHDARKYVHLLRSRHAAIAIGASTLVKDNPELTVRHVAGQSPVRIIFARNPLIGKASRIRKSAHKIRTIFVCPGKKAGAISQLADGAEIWYTGHGTETRRLKAFLKRACAQGLSSIFVEGGSALASSLLEKGLINRIYLFYGNCLLGSGLNGIQTAAALPMNKAFYLADYDKIDFGDSFMITGRVKKRG